MIWRSVSNYPPTRRPGFTMAECVIALAVLTSVAVVVVELSTRMLADRSRLEARYEAEQVEINVLELARATPWEELAPAWAGERKLPAHVIERWPSTKLTVRVEPEPNRPRLKRVTVEVHWDGDKQTTWPPTTMTALFAARTTGGGK